MYKNMIRVEFDTISELTNLIYELEKGSSSFEYHIKLNTENEKFMMIIEELKSTNTYEKFQGGDDN